MDSEQLISHHSSSNASGATTEEIEQWEKQIPEWEVSETEISREFNFADYYETIAFVNAIAWIAHGEDHHPDLIVGYNRCIVKLSTHSAGGLSKNDFIVAAKIDRVFNASA